MAKPVIVVHYHELWLKGRNRNFFLGKFMLALRRTLADFPSSAIRQPGRPRGDRAWRRRARWRGRRRDLERVLGVAYLAVAAVRVERGSATISDALCQAAWDEVEPLSFSTFAVRAKRSDKSFPIAHREIEVAVGRYLARPFARGGPRRSRAT